MGLIQTLTKVLCSMVASVLLWTPKKDLKKSWIFDLIVLSIFPAAYSCCLKPALQIK